MSEPAENMRVTPQLIEHAKFRVFFAKMDQEVARCAAVEPSRLRRDCGTERVDGPLE
jgi:hypothetical protein